MAFLCQRRGLPPFYEHRGLASLILRFSQVQPQPERNAFSGLLHVPGWEYLKFSPCIKQEKRFWNVSGPKYADFWDAEKIIIKLCKLPMDMNDVAQVRDRAIIVLRLFHLCKSIDMAQAQRTSAPGEGQPQYW